MDKYVGARIRMRRMQVGMSQEKLATGMELSFQQVQKYEKGTNRVSASRLQKLCELLEVTVSLFFEGAPGSSKIAVASPAQDLMIMLSTRAGVRLASAINVIKHDQELMDLVVGFAQTVATRVASPERKVTSIASRAKKRATR